MVGTGTPPRFARWTEMIFFSVSAAPDPANLLLTAAEVARRQLLQKRQSRLAAARATRLLARLRRGRGAAL